MYGIKFKKYVKTRWKGQKLYDSTHFMTDRRKHKDGWHIRPEMDKLVGLLTYTQGKPPSEMPPPTGPILNQGDVLVVKRMAHLSDEFAICAQIISKVLASGANIVVLDLGLDTTLIDPTSPERTALLEGFDRLKKIPTDDYLDDSISVRDGGDGGGDGAATAADRRFIHLCQRAGLSYRRRSRISLNSWAIAASLVCIAVLENSLSG